MLLSILPAAAEGQNAVVRSDPVQLEVNAGELATLTVVLADAQSVYGIDVNATFDPQLVEVVDADPARDGIQMTPGTFPKPDFVARNVADNQAGTLHYAITQVHPTEAVNGSGGVFSVQFRAKAPSGQSPFTLTLVELTDRDGVALAVQPENGMIRVLPSGQAASFTPTPTVTVPSATPTSEPVATTAPTATTSAPANSPATVAPTNTPEPLLSPSPEPPANTANASLGDTPVADLQSSAAAGDDSVALEETPPPTPTSQAVAAAEVPESAAAPAPPAATSSEPPASNDAAPSPDTNVRQTVPDESTQNTLQRPPVKKIPAREVPAGDPGTLLLIIGVLALAVAAVTAILMVVVVRR